MRFYTSWILALTACAWMATGCAKPPLVEVADAENALNTAEMEGAGDYASEEFQIAQQALADARAKMDEKDFSKARTAAIDAKAKAEAAQAAIENGKAEVKAQAAQAIALMEERLGPLSQQVEQVKSPAARELKLALSSLESDLTRIVEDHVNGSYAKVMAAAPGVLQNMESLSSQVAQALAAPPAKKSSRKR